MKWLLRILGAPGTHLALVAAAVVLVYAGGLDAPFTFDDERCIVRSPVVRSFEWFAHPRRASSLPSSLQCGFPARYLGHLTFAVNYRLGGLEVTGYHLFNVAVHLANALLVYLLVRLAFRTPALQSRGDGRQDLPAPLVALFSALIFACHPLQTQAVTYVVQRFASLAALFYLLAAVLYLRWRLAGPGRGRAASYAGALAAAVAAVVTKENAVTLPAALGLLEVALLGGPWRRRLLGLVPFALAPLALLALMGVFRAGGVAEADASLQGLAPVGRGEYLLTELPVVATYLRLFLLPVGQSVDHDFPLSRSLLEGPVLLSLLLVAGLLAAALALLVRARRTGAPRPERALVSLGILWFFLTLSVESWLVPLADVIVEHRLYLPSVGLSLAVVTLVFLARRRLERARPAAAALLVPALSAAAVALGGAAFARNRVWSDEVRLWEDAARKAPQKVRPRMELGALHAAAGRLDLAAREIETAISLRPDYAEAHNSLGVILRRQGRPAAALESYRTALRLRPDFAEARHNLALLLASQGRLDDAVRELEEAVRARPDYAEGHNALGVFYARQGRLEEAAREFRRVLEIDPGHAKARANLAQALDGLRR